MKCIYVNPSLEYAEEYKTYLESLPNGSDYYDYESFVTEGLGNFLAGAAGKVASSVGKVAGGIYSGAKSGFKQGAGMNAQQAPQAQSQFQPAQQQQNQQAQAWDNFVSAAKQNPQGFVQALTQSNFDNSTKNKLLAMMSQGK